MTTLLARAHVVSVRLGAALRRHWRRIALGAFCGWLLSSVLGAFALVWLESAQFVSSDETAALLGAAMVWSGVAVGAVIAYAMRPATRVTER